MNPQTIELVQSSWARVLPIAPQAAQLFYEELFALDPALRALFKHDLQAQGARLMRMIGTAVGQLNALDTLVPVLQELGQRHNGYGVKPLHYEIVGQALLSTLSKGLGPAFTDEVEAAWVEVYGVMASVMGASMPMPQQPMAAY